MVFLNFAEQLDLTEEEWEQLFDFLVPTVTQKKRYKIEQEQYSFDF